MLMTPDLRRLCEAAAANGGSVPVDYAGGYDVSADPADWEDVVRAVLVALRSPEKDTLAAASVDFLRDVTDPWDCMPLQMDEAFGLPTNGAEVWAPAEERIRPRVQRSFTAMIDHILSEPDRGLDGDGVIITVGQSGPQFYEGQRGKGSWTD